MNSNVNHIPGTVCTVVKGSADSTDSRTAIDHLSSKSTVTLHLHVVSDNCSGLQTVTYAGLTGYCDACSKGSQLTCFDKIDRAATISGKSCTYLGFDFNQCSDKTTLHNGSMLHSVWVPKRHQLSSIKGGSWMTFDNDKHSYWLAHASLNNSTQVTPNVDMSLMIPYWVHCNGSVLTCRVSRWVGGCAKQLLLGLWRTVKISITAQILSLWNTSCHIPSALFAKFCAN